MSAIGLGEDSEITTLVLRELSKESLEELPNIRSSYDGGGCGIGAVRKACTDGLINVEHVCVLVEAVGIERWSRSTVDKMAGSIFLLHLRNQLKLWSLYIPGTVQSRMSNLDHR